MTHSAEAPEPRTSVVTAHVTAIRRPPLTIEDGDQEAQPCPGYVPTSKTCERCGQPPSEHSHREVSPA